MPRDLPIGNGSLLASFDLDYQIRDFYYPGSARKIMRWATPGASVLWLAGEFSWLDRHNWKLERTYVPDTLVTAVTASHPRLPLRLHFNDAVDYEKNILLRQVMGAEPFRQAAGAAPVFPHRHQRPGKRNRRHGVLRA